MASGIASIYAAVPCDVDCHMRSTSTLRSHWIDDNRPGFMTDNGGFLEEVVRRQTRILPYPVHADKAQRLIRLGRATPCDERRNRRLRQSRSAQDSPRHAYPRQLFPWSSCRWVGGGGAAAFGPIGMDRGLPFMPGEPLGGQRQSILVQISKRKFSSSGVLACMRVVSRVLRISFCRQPVPVLSGDDL